jgi:hypothetical protein
VELLNIEPNITLLNPFTVGTNTAYEVRDEANGPNAAQPPALRLSSWQKCRLRRDLACR